MAHRVFTLWPDLKGGHVPYLATTPNVNALLPTPRQPQNLIGFYFSDVPLGRSTVKFAGELPACAPSWSFTISFRLREKCQDILARYWTRVVCFRNRSSEHTPDG